LKPVLVIPACEPGRGGGHLTRCLALVNGLQSRGRDARIFLVGGDAHADKLLDAADFNRNWLIRENNLINISWECIVLDRFQTPPEELARWSKLAPVIGIDEGGVSRNCFDFLIDILPGCHSSGANIADPSLLPLPTINNEQVTGNKEKPSASQVLKILISFGQEDAAGLGHAVAEALEKQNSDAVDITLLQGGLRNLVDHLPEYDLVFTHYGITAFEALYMGVPVLLVSPGALHEKLAKAAGFYSLGVGKKKADKIKRLLFNKDAINHSFLLKLKERCSTLAVKHNLNHTPRQSLAELINAITPDVSRNCPVCKVACDTARHGTAISRFAERTYHRCARCGIIAMNRLNPPSIEYGKEYFFECYQRQYGKTYMEDFPNLIAMAKRRLAVIKKLSQKRFTQRHKGTEEDAELSKHAQNFMPLCLRERSFSEQRLLDIGCAYGPFLAAARDEGFTPCGIDPAEDAVRYVTETLGIPAVHGFFPHAALTPPYSVITLWYVIEHFRDCVPVLAEIRKLLKPGGVLAFATPSFTGISGRASLKGFLERSPADHWTIWSPAAARKALTAAGFTVKKVINSGHHPERFPVLGKFARNVKSPLYWLLLAVSKIFSLGDTFEVYAIIKNFIDPGNYQ